MFLPVIPFGGNLGWSFLSRTKDTQEATFAASATVSQAASHFRENIATIQTAEDLVNDRRLLEVALGAFGLSEDINNKFFVKKVLEEGTLNPDAFANRLADKRYFNLAKAFSFDVTPPNTVLSDFPDQIVTAFQSRLFEVAVGEQDQNLRLALSLERELGALVGRGLSEKAAWFTIMGTPPLRSVFEGAFGLPPQTGALDLDRQLEIFREKSIAAFGTSNPLDLAEGEAREDLVRKFLLRSESNVGGAATSSGAVALSLLQQQTSGLG